MKRIIEEASTSKKDSAMWLDRLKTMKTINNEIKEFIKRLKKKATKRVYLDFDHKPCKLDNGPIDWAYCGGCGRFVIEEGCTCGTVTLKDIDELTGEI